VRFISKVCFFLGPDIRFFIYGVGNGFAVQAAKVGAVLPQMAGAGSFSHLLLQRLESSATEKTSLAILFSAALQCLKRKARDTISPNSIQKERSVACAGTYSLIEGNGQTLGENPPACAGL
jgi:hypothetical protein